MTMTELGACFCGEPAARTIGSVAYCRECAETVLAPIRAKYPSGHGYQVGKMRPDWGDDCAELECDNCHAGWVGPIGETCAWCLQAADEPRKAKLAVLPPINLNGAPAATQAPISEEPVDDPDDDLRRMLIDWPAFWANDHQDAEWLAEPVLAAKRSAALFAPGGHGKSLLALWLAAKLASGVDPFSGRRQPPVDVLYLDYEMTEADLSERLEDMGFGPASDLACLHYALLPSLPGLDRPEGGRAVVRLAELCAASLVIVDTFGRAVHGDENDADTVRAWYRWTGLHLKAAGRAFLRVDHAGKDLGKGQRGSSAKNDDVDIVWQMTVKDAGVFVLEAKKRRMGWVPLRVEIVKSDDPVAYALTQAATWPVGTREAAAVLDELDVPEDASNRAAAKIMSEAGRGVRAVVVRAAQKYRRERSGVLHFVGDTNFDRLHPAVIEVENKTREDAGWPLLGGAKRSPGRDEGASQKSGRTPTADEPDALRDAPPSSDAFGQVIQLGRTSGRTGPTDPTLLGPIASPPRGTQGPNVRPEPDLFEEF